VDPPAETSAVEGTRLMFDSAANTDAAAMLRMSAKENNNRFISGSSLVE